MTVWHIRDLVKGATGCTCVQRSAAQHCLFLYMALRGLATRQCKQFEAMSKVLDAVELNCLVRAEMGVGDGSRVGQ